MPIQTRSAVRKAQNPDAVTCVEEGVYVRTTPSATGEGIHIRWEYDGAPETPNPVKTGPTNGTSGLSATYATYSHSSLFDGSLSSLSSSGSSDLSDSPFESPLPNNSSKTADHSVFDTYYNLSGSESFSSGQDSTLNPPGPRRQLPVPSTPKNRTEGSIGPIRTPHGRSARPLQRTPVKHWRRNAVGKLVPADEDDILNPPLRREPAPFTDPQDIFERELAKMVKQREETAMALGKTDDEDQDMDCDAAHAFVPRGGAATSNTTCLGPSGTEILDDSFGAAPTEGEKGVYPHKWVERQSTGLRSFPTETSL